MVISVEHRHMSSRTKERDTKEAMRMIAIRERRIVGFRRLVRLSVLQIMSSCPLFVAGVVTLVMALPHVKYPVFNFGPVIVSLLVFPMAFIGLLATRIAAENASYKTRRIFKYMIVGNFVLSVLCSVLAGLSSFFSIVIMEQCSDENSDYYEQCIPNSNANIGLSMVDAVVCLILLVLSLLGVVYFYKHGYQLCFQTYANERIGPQLALAFPGQSSCRGQMQGYV